MHCKVAEVDLTIAAMALIFVSIKAFRRNIAVLMTRRIRLYVSVNTFLECIVL